MLRFDHVTKQFTEDSYGVKEITFELEPGELVILTGPSGSGKTTLMRLMTKEYTPSEGEITFEEFDLNRLKNSQIHHLRRRIGVVFQDYRLLPELNAWENIALPLSIVGKKQDEIEERVTDLLKLVELPDKAQLFPRQLSGGEAQRISIARALATGPSIIFADEPTGNLDAETSLKIARLLRKINELGTSLIFATHDPHVLKELGGSRVMHLEYGELKDDGSKKKSASKPKKKSKLVAKDNSEEDKDKDENEKAESSKTEAKSSKSDDKKVETEKKAETDADTETEQAERKKSGGFFSKLLKRRDDKADSEDADSNDAEEKDNKDSKDSKERS